MDKNTIKVSIRGFDPCLYVTRHFTCLECTTLDLKSIAFTLMKVN